MVVRLVVARQSTKKAMKIANGGREEIRTLGLLVANDVN